MRSAALLPPSHFGHEGSWSSPPVRGMDAVICAEHLMPTVFVVDSGIMRGNSLLHTVREAGFHTLPMSNADMALAVLNAIRADLLLIDLSNTETGGMRLIEEVRRNEHLRRMPILAIGAQAEGE